MDFTKIIRYQEINESLNNFKDQVKNSDEYNNFLRLKNNLAELEKNYNNNYENFCKLEKSVIDIVTEMNNLEIDLKETVEDLTVSLEKYDSIDKMDPQEARALDNLEKRIVELNSKVKSIQDTIKKLSEVIPQDEEKINKTQARCDVANRDYAALYKKVQNQGLELMKEKKTLEAEIDPEMMALYLKQSNNGKVKAFYEMTETNLKRQTCAKCFKIIGNSIDKLKASGDYVECPECYSILFIK